MVEIHNCAGVIIEQNDKILLLHRKEDNYQGGAWDLPGGKIKEGESPIETAKREVYEETRCICNETELENIRNFNWSFPAFNVFFQTFRLKLNKPFNVKLNPKEHTEYKWLTPKECYRMRLIHGFHDLLEKIYGFK